MEKRGLIRVKTAARSRVVTIISIVQALLVIGAANGYDYSMRYGIDNLYYKNGVFYDIYWPASISASGTYKLDFETENKVVVDIANKTMRFYNSYWNLIVYLDLNSRIGEDIESIEAYSNPDYWCLVEVNTKFATATYHYIYAVNFIYRTFKYLDKIEGPPLRKVQQSQCNKLCYFYQNEGENTYSNHNIFDFSKDGQIMDRNAFLKTSILFHAEIKQISGTKKQYVEIHDNGPSLPLSSFDVVGDENWDGQFSNQLAGASGGISAMAASGDDIYIGGPFGQAGGVLAYGVAKWDGSRWSSLGSGMSDRVNAIAANGSDVYVGGWFKEVEGIEANNIAKWDGRGWSVLGSGVYYYDCHGFGSSCVNAIAMSGNDVYVGGTFNYSGGSYANNIAKWDGSHWSTLGSGVKGVIFAMAVNGSDVYVGGRLSRAGSVDVNNIAKWDGSAWSSLGDGVDGDVYAICLVNGGVVVGGSFTQAGGVAANNIAEWNGSAWSSLGNGVNAGVGAIVVSGGGVVAGGWFTQAGGVEVNNIAKWDGSHWSPLGGGITGDGVYAMAASGTSLYAGGDFTQAGEVTVDNIAEWDGSQWSPLGSRVNGGVTDDVKVVAISGNTVYAGGQFTQAGTADANYIAKYTGGEWSKLGSGVEYWVNTIAVNGSDVYAGGWFQQAGGTAANYIARWNGSQWYSLGGGVDNEVKTIAVGGSGVYAGGCFRHAGGVVANRIARWDGSGWHPLGDGMTGDYDQVWAIFVNGSDVYVGGDFTQAGGIEANGIAKWDGSQWSALGSGVNGAVYAITMSDGVLYAAGAFSQAGGVDAKNIAKWDGSGWSPLGGGVNGYVKTIAANGTDVFVGGDFHMAGGLEANNIAKWNGSSWFSLGSGVNWNINALAVSGKDVYVGGEFYIAGGRPFSHFSCWHECIQNPSVDYIYTQEGWYMVSLPVIPPDSSVATLFPAAMGGAAFTWDPASASYVQTDKMGPGNGYWLAFAGAAASTVAGVPMTSYTRHFSLQGWHMIGGVMGGADFTNPNDAPDGSVLSPAFGWDPAGGQYIPTTTLDQEEGYWAAVFGACDLTVGGSGSGFSKSFTKANWETFLNMHGKTPPSPPKADLKAGKAAAIPKTYGMSQNYPNPFNPETRIGYQMPDAGLVRLVVYNIMGQVVKKLVDKQQNAGYFEVVWDGRDDRGLCLGSGMYLVKMEAGRFSTTRKLLLMR
jgi:hypothetical protein